MATSGLVFAIHRLDFSKPENTRFQYGSSVLPRSSAAPMAGTCDEPTPAMILATAHFRFAGAFRAEGFFLEDFTDFDFPDAAARKFFPAVLSRPDLLRLPSTERPPASIMAA